MTIRRATQKDIPTLLKLLSQVLDIHYEGRPDIFRPGAVKYTENELRLLLCDEGRPVFVAEIDKKVCGYVFCIFKQHLSDNILTDIKTLYIDDLCVDEDCRGQHIGKELYDFVISFARSENCYNVTLNVWALNKNAESFYRSLGMTVQKTQMEKLLCDDE